MSRRPGKTLLIVSEIILDKRCSAINWRFDNEQKLRRKQEEARN
jgi:hypothetical protein